MNLIKPNMMTVADCRAAIKYNANIKLSTFDINVLRTDLQALANYLQSVDQNANDVLRKLHDSLDTDTIAGALDDASEEDAPSEYAAELKTHLSNRSQGITRLRAELNTPLYTLETMNLTDNKYRIRELESTKTKLHSLATKENNEEQYDALLRKKKSLDQAIELYQGQTLYDRLKPVLDEVEKTVDAVADSPANYKKALIKQGVQATKALLTSLNAEVKYDDMCNAREELEKKITARKARKNSLADELYMYFNEINQLEDFESLRSIKEEYVTQVKHIIEAFDAFIKEVFTGTDQNAIATRFVTSAPLFRTYADELFAKWLRT